MSWPKSGTFGISDNPITDSPYTQNEFPGEGAAVLSFFLLLNSGIFELLSGEFLLLL